MPGKNREGYERPNPPRRKGRFMGGYFDPELVRLVNNEVFAKPGASRSQVMAELMWEALRARQRRRENDKE